MPPLAVASSKVVAIAMVKYKTADEYIDSFPANVQEFLSTIRRTIQKAVPNAEETMSYGMPAFKHHGRQLVYYAGWKQHVSIYPASMTVFDAFGADLAQYEVSKGTIKFPLDKLVPVSLVRKIALFRAKENAAAAQAKASAKAPSKKVVSKAKK